MQVYLIASDLGGGVRGARLGGDLLVLHDSRKDAVLAGVPITRLATDIEQVYLGDEVRQENIRAKHLTTLAAFNTRLCQTIAQEARVPALFLSGDHSSAIGIISGLLQRYTDLGVVWVDAHCDMNTPSTSGSGNVHGMPLGALLRADALLASAASAPASQPPAAWAAMQALSVSLPPENLFLIGARSIDPAEKQCLERYNIPNITVPQAREMGMAAVAQHALKHLGHCKHVFVSFDIDSLDELLVPGTGTPVDGGFTQAEALTLNEALLRSPELCAWEITEFNPLLDNTDRTLEVTYEHLGLVARAMRSQA